MKITTFLCFSLIVFVSLVNAVTFKNIGKSPIRWRVFDSKSNDYVFKTLMPGHVIDLKTGNIYGPGEFEQLSIEEIDRIHSQEEVSIQTQNGKIYHSSNWSTDVNIDMFDDSDLKEINTNRLTKKICHHRYDSSLNTQAGGIDKQGLLAWMKYLNSINR